MSPLSQNEYRLHTRTYDIGIDIALEIYISGGYISRYMTKIFSTYICAISAQVSYFLVSIIRVGPYAYFTCSLPPFKKSGRKTKEINKRGNKLKWTQYAHKTFKMQSNLYTKWHKSGIVCLPHGMFYIQTWRLYGNSPWDFQNFPLPRWFCE